MPGRPKTRIAIYAFIVILGLICVFAPSCSKNGIDNDDDTVDTTDTIPPGTVVDLKVDYVTTSTITLSWTAPGDDGFSGLSVQYDFRFSADSIRFRHGMKRFGPSHFVSSIFFVSTQPPTWRRYT
ncbi:MAG: fibronectin type III domain-containing protein [candidate division Zixibacteria bacterium]|nr:fibronectin type III domain-containing protein [candidate division Zixibacteria bacterium]